MSARVFYLHSRRPELCDEHWILCLSKGSDEEHGVAESRKFWGSTLWEEDARNDDTTHTSF